MTNKLALDEKNTKTHKKEINLNQNAVLNPQRHLTSLRYLSQSEMLPWCSYRVTPRQNVNFITSAMTTAVVAKNMFPGRVLA